MSLKNRLAKLEQAHAARDGVAYDVRLVDIITPEMRQDQSEAHARGQAYYIVELKQEGES